MTSPIPRILILAAATVAAGCTINLNGKGTVNAEGEMNGDGDGGGGSGDGDGGDGDGDGGGGDGGDGGSSNDATIDGVFVIDVHDYDTNYICDIYWLMSGDQASCSDCDIAFDVDLTNDSGSCGGVGNTSGIIEWANGATYFDGGYIGVGYLTGDGTAIFYTSGYEYGSSYLYYYYGGGYY